MKLKLIPFLMLAFLLTACPDNEPTINRTYTITIDQTTQFEMIYVPGGFFNMGATAEQAGLARPNENPVHNVGVDRFYITKTEVNVAVWRAITGQTRGLSDSDPVTGVTYDECQAFVDTLNSRARAVLPEGMKFALPTEAQWEYAARGADQSKGYIYAGSSNSDDVAWTDSVAIHATGMRHPNELGIFDMSGNAAEWCRDWFGSYTSEDAINPLGPDSGTYRVVRGGSAADPAELSRVSARNLEKPDAKNDYIGFRMVLSSY